MAFSPLLKFSLVLARRSDGMFFERNNLNIDAIREADKRVGSETVGMLPAAFDGEAKRAEDGDSSFQLANGDLVDQMVERRR